jgi:hypothetical protein
MTSASMCTQKPLSSVDSNLVNASRSAASDQRLEAGPDSAGSVQQQTGNDVGQMIRLMVKALTSPVSGEPTALWRLTWSR